MDTNKLAVISSPLSDLILLPRADVNLLLLAVRQAADVMPQSYDDPEYTALVKTLTALDEMGYDIL